MGTKRQANASEQRGARCGGRGAVDMLRNWIKSNRGFLVLLLCFGIFRTAVADWNPIPSGSMRPTLLEGDVVFVNRLAYDVKLPLTDVEIGRAHV